MKIHISWDEVDEMVERLAERIKSIPNLPRSLYGIPRGGLIPAVMLSHRLKIPLVGSPLDDSLIVDEIADTGQTLKAFSQRSAVLIWKEQSVVKPSFYGRFTTSQSWLVFPWEDDS